MELQFSTPFNAPYTLNIAISPMGKFPLKSINMLVKCYFLLSSLILKSLHFFLKYMGNTLSSEFGVFISLNQSKDAEYAYTLKFC